MQAIILAGGLGTRLRSVVSDRPKPMALVEGKPFLEYVLQGLKKSGIDDIIFAVVRSLSQPTQAWRARRPRCI